MIEMRLSEFQSALCKMLHLQKRKCLCTFCAVWKKELIIIYSECGWISKVELVRQRQRENRTAKADKESLSCSGWFWWNLTYSEILLGNQKLWILRRDTCWNVTGGLQLPASSDTDIQFQICFRQTWDWVCVALNAPKESGKTLCRLYNSRNIF